MSEYKIFDSSVKASEQRTKHGFPWDKLECGKSFAVKKEQIKGVTLRPLCSIMGRQLNMKFKMIEHDEYYEVARVK